jgi:hypothetical protein
MFFEDEKSDSLRAALGIISRRGMKEPRGFLDHDPEMPRPVWAKNSSQQFVMGERHARGKDTSRRRRAVARRI